jgi:hypothetical protein
MDRSLYKVIPKSVWFDETIIGVPDHFHWTATKLFWQIWSISGPVTRVNKHTLKKIR